MKNFLKHFLTKNNLFLILIFIIAAGIRFYNFPNRITFWTEQARSLIVSADYLKKPSLLGQEYFRQDSNSHIIYSGALFNYSLVPLVLLSNYDPIKTTMFFGLLNLFTGFVIYLTTKKLFNQKIAIISIILFLFNDFMIYHSLFIWNYNYLPLVGILVLYFSWKFINEKKSLYIFFVGLLCGIGISLQFLFTPLAILVLIANIWKSKKWLISILIFSVSIALGNLPMLLFDLRHNFYETKTLFQFFLDTLNGKSDAGFAYYYLLPFWSVGCILAAAVISRLSNWSKLLAGLVIIVYLYVNINSQKVSFNSPTGMPKGINISDIDKVSHKIAMEVEGGFNVAEVLDFDKQAYVLRYFIEYKYNKTPLGISEYPNSKLLYVLSQKDYNFDKSGIWEIYSGGKYDVSLFSSVGKGYAVYRLSKK